MNRLRLLQTLKEKSKDSVLRHIATPIPQANLTSASVRRLAQQLNTTMERDGGVGIAAPQVGVNWRLFVAKLDERYDLEEDEGEDQENTSTDSKKSSRLSSAARTARKFFSFRPAPQPSLIMNPVVHRQSSQTKKGIEGCLSVPGMLGMVPRPVDIDVSYFDETGKEVHRSLSGFRARLFLHEYDHLEGKLYIDHIVEPEDLFTEESFEATQRS